jgi:hypothetical protein
MNGSARTNDDGKILKQRLAREGRMSRHQMVARYGSIMTLTERLQPPTHSD